MDAPEAKWDSPNSIQWTSAESIQLTSAVSTVEPVGTAALRSLADRVAVMSADAGLIDMHILTHSLCDEVDRLTAALDRVRALAENAPVASNTGQAVMWFGGQQAVTSRDILAALDADA